MAPVGTYVSSFSVMSDLSKSSACGPSYVQRPDHSRHHDSVLAVMLNGSIGSGRETCEGYQAR